MSALAISYSAGGALAVIEFDATISETHLAGNEITEHPVEKGVNVTDHVRPRVDRITLDVVVTNAPTRVPRTNMGGATGGVTGLDLVVPTNGDLPIAIPGIGAALKGAGVFRGTQVVQAQVLQFDSFDRVADVYHELKNLQETATLVTITTSLVEYENFVFENLSAPRQAGEGDSIHFQIDAKHLRFVTAKTVPAPASPVGVKKTNKGSQPTKDAGPKSSLALKGAQALGLAH